jgi:diadenosine tetraphosphate (Ap4A) HIT family hydrolase
MDAVADCPHCRALGEDRLWSGDRFRVVLVHDTGFEGWCRVIWNEHVAEFTDLPPTDRQAVFDAAMAVEEALRAEIRPAKINIAALATAMPHLHVHVIPRFPDDPTFPDPVWLPARQTPTRLLPDGFAAKIRTRLAAALGEPRPSAK